MPANETAAAPPAVPNSPPPKPAVARPSTTPRPVKPAGAPAARKTVTAAPKPSLTAAPPKAEPAPTSTWASFFRNWPEALPKRGVVISQLNESTVFKSFMLQGDLLLLERISPDSVGARFVVLPFDEIATVKYTDQLPQEAFESAGFVGKLAK